MPAPPNPSLTVCLSVWAQCSASCGEGVQQRQVVCKGSESGGRCEGDKPETVQGCHVALCPGERRRRRCEEGGGTGQGRRTGGDQPSCMPPAHLGFRGMPAKKVGLKVPDGAGRERVKRQPTYCTFLLLALIFAVDGFGFSGSLGMMEMGTLEFILGVFWVA